MFVCLQARAAKEALAEELASATAAAQEREKALTEETEKWVLEAEQKQAEHAASAAKQAAQVAKLQEVR